MKKNYLFTSLFLLSVNLFAQQNLHRVKNLKITILSTMLASKGIGEWGFSALIEADSLRILFDTGGHENTVWQNSQDLKLDLSNIPVLILSHNHDDHTSGWLSLRKQLMKQNTAALGITHVAKDFFLPRIEKNGSENNGRKQDSIAYTNTEGKVIVSSAFHDIYPGIYLTGNVPRPFPEKNYTVTGKMKDQNGQIVDDNEPDDMSLVIRTEKGLVLVSGCGHSGIINTIQHIKNALPEPVYTAIGGFHLLNTSDENIHWTAEQLNASGIEYFMGAHCTGIEPVYQIREWANLKRGNCRVGAVGDIFDAEKGFLGSSLAR